MAIAVDASTPAVVQSATEVTSAAFTPPSGAILLALVTCNQASTDTITSDPTLTSNAGLVWNKIGVQDSRTSAQKGIAYAAWALITESKSMTVTAKKPASSTHNGVDLQVVVVTGSPSSSIIGKSGVGTNLAGKVSASYTSSSSGSMGFLVNCDWEGNNAAPTVAAGTTLISTIAEGTERWVRDWNVRQTNTASSVETVTIGASGAVAASENNWVYFEVLPAIIEPVFSSIPPTFKTPRKLWKPFPFAVEQKISVPFSSILSFKAEISAPLRVSQKLSTTILSKFESSGKLIVAYKLNATTLESKLSITAPLKVEYKLGVTTVESKFSILAPLKVQYKLPKSELESKFSLSSTLKIRQKLSSTIESKFSLSSTLKSSVRLSSAIETKLSISAPLKTKFNLGRAEISSEFVLSGNLLVVHEQEIPNLPERIVRPKIIIPGPAVKWDWWLCRTSDLGQITKLSSAHSKNLQLMLNQSGTASFWMHLEDKKTEYIEELKTSIVCYRNGKAVFSGPIFKCVENADNTPNATLQVTAFGWFELLNHRIVHTGREWEEMSVRYSGRIPSSEEKTLKEQYEAVISEGKYKPVATESALQLYYSKIGESTSPLGVPRNEIAVDLINRANIDVPTGITIGLNPEVSSLNYTVPQFHPVGELITQLTSIENGFDFKIDPLTRKFNIYYNLINEKTTIKGLGQDRGQGVRFTYPGNCVSANRTSYGEKTQNRTEAQGQYGIGKAESLSSIAENGLFEKSESLTDVTNVDILIAYANIQVATLEQPFRILTFNPRPVNNSESYAVPRPFEDYEIGDVVYAKVKKGPRFAVGISNLQPVRIFGLNLAIDDNGIERVTQVQTVYSQ